MATGSRCPAREGNAGIQKIRILLSSLRTLRRDMEVYRDIKVCVYIYIYIYTDISAEARGLCRLDPGARD